MDALTELIDYYGSLKESYQQEELVELLREIQGLYGEISPQVQEQISERLTIGLPIIKNIIKLYPSLHETLSAHRITVCTGRQCAGKNGAAVLKEVERLLGIQKGQTTKDNRFTLTTQSCLKHCRTAPNLRVDDTIYEFVSPKQVADILKQYK